MKRLIGLTWLCLVGFLSQTAFSQDIFFYVDFGGNPPPHTPGVPDSGARLSDDMLYAAIFLDGTMPSSGSILENLGGGMFAQVFQFTNLVFAGYPPPATGPAFDYEGAWQLTDSQIQDLLAGKWYAQVTYSNGDIFRGQFVVVPEPSSAALLFSGMVVTGWSYRNFRKKNSG
jgi:hypothetical protein